MIRFSIKFEGAKPRPDPQARIVEDKDSKRAESRN